DRDFIPLITGAIPTKKQPKRNLLPRRLAEKNPPRRRNPRKVLRPLKPRRLRKRSRLQKLVHDFSGERRLLACRTRQLAETETRRHFRIACLKIVAGRATGNYRLAACAPQKPRASKTSSPPQRARQKNNLVVTNCFAANA